MVPNQLREMSPLKRDSMYPLVTVIRMENTVARVAMTAVLTNAATMRGSLSTWK
ncbi:hypothetical protein D3C71_1039210 [compost metagenome]